MSMEGGPSKPISILNAVKLTVLYCLPAIIAVMLLNANYYKRIQQVGDHIDTQLKEVEEAIRYVKEHSNPEERNDREKIVEALLQHKLLKKVLEDANVSEHMKKLVRYYVNHRIENIALEEVEYVRENRKDIDKYLFEIWLRNASLISLMALFPFILLGSHLGFSKKLLTDYSLRVAAVRQSWWMKFLIAFLLAYGWTYIINPSGRGVGTIQQFLIAVDLTQKETLPIFLRDMQIKPIMAGFLGWYLYLLTYFFSKLTTNDVISTKPYGLMFQKFLFTYGIAVILPTLQSASGGGLQSETGYSVTNLIAFLTGYFPMSAFSLLKDSGLKIMHGAKEEKGQLQELPGISRWQILRLEEEGIQSMGTLAYCCHEELRKTIPAMSNLIDYWVDIARLYTVLGQENYQKVKKHCRTASEFVSQVDNPKFIEALAAENIINAKETARTIKRMFPDSLTYLKNE